MELFNEFISSLLKMSPVIGLLCIAIWYFYKENIQLKAKNDELNNFVRDEGINNTKVLQTVTNTLDKLITQNDDQIDDLKEWIDLKLKNNK